MRILRVSQKIYPDVKGGGPYHVHAMSRDQTAMGHDVTVLTIRHDDSLPHVEERDGYRIIRFDSLCSPLGNDISPELANYLRKVGDFDVIHAHSHLYFATNLAALKRLVGGTPLAITNHGLFSQNAPEWVFDLYLRTVGRWTFNQADLIFCYTGTDKERVQEYGVLSPIEVVSNGIDTERFSSESPMGDVIDSDGPVILFVGRFVEGKRPIVALEAFARVRDTYPNAELHLCGEGPLRGKLEGRAEELAVREAVTFLGHVTYKEMPAVYRSANVLVLPSRAEGVPRTVMESLASGVPVVSSELSQVRDAFRESVTYVDGDADAFGETICERLNEETWVELEETFCWERTVAETTAALEWLVEDGL